MSESIETRCVQGGYQPGCGEPRQVPIIQSTTFKYDESMQLGELFDLKAAGYFYSRLQNPTLDNVASKICALEGGTAAMLTSSGQAANFLPSLILLRLEIILSPCLPFMAAPLTFLLSPLRRWVLSVRLSRQMQLMRRLTQHSDQIQSASLVRLLQTLHWLFLILNVGQRPLMTTMYH